MTPRADFSEERRELATLLASATFQKSPNLARLLEYICTKYFEGTVGELKEYNIGVEALGRPSEFDPATNSIVRVEVHRLREKLKRFYETEGCGHEPMISLQVGHYVPEFTRRERQFGGAKAAPAAPDEVCGPKATSAPATRGEAERWATDAPEASQRLPSAASGMRRLLLRSPRLLALMLGLVFIALVITLWKIQGLHKGLAEGSGPAASADLHSSALGEGREIRILAGYTRDKYIDRSGRVWSADRYFHGGTAAYQSLKVVARTLDPTIYETSRVGEFTYDIPLKPGVYELRLYFAETFFGPGTFAGGGESSRIFAIDVNGKPLLEDVDPTRDAGGNNTADMRVFKDVSPAEDGYLHLRFRRLRDVPFVNALEITPGTPGKLRPLRLVARENSWTDEKGRVWRPDCYFSGGRLAVHKAPVEGAPDSGLFEGERFGNFTYAIPVAPGKYAVTLYFAETYFGEENAGLGGEGSRVFDVYCNGVALLRNFDIYREAGGANRGLRKTFHGLVPSASGKLTLSFIPTRNYALLNAIEVNDESK
jgi:hypothetical protein